MAATAAHIFAITCALPLLSEPGASYIAELATTVSTPAAAISPLAALRRTLREADTVAAQVEAVARCITDTGLAQTLAGQCT